MAYLLDTNILIGAMKGLPQIRQRLEKIPLAQVLLSTIVLGELEFGVEKSAHVARNRNRINELVSNIPTVGIDAEISRKYGQIRASLEKRGAPIGANDLWIAAQAVTLQAVLVTDNTREFSRVPGLITENWIDRG